MEQRNYKSAIFTIPNLLSFFWLGLIPVIVWQYLGRENALLAGLLLILSGLTDVVDGFIARHFHMISDLGKALDPIADKLTQGAMLICLAIRFPDILWPLVLMGAKELFMGISGLLVIRRTGIVPSARWHGKAATVLLYATMILHVFWTELPRPVSRTAIAGCCVMILVSFLLYALQNLQALKNAAPGKPCQKNL